MRILLLSAYDALSHRLWRQRLGELLPAHHWTQLALPARHFNWRIRSNSLLWGSSPIPELDQDYDLLVATSMVDLAALRGLRPRLAKLPTLLYFHENQFHYPANADPAISSQANIEPLLVPVYSALCADAIVFNSQFNQDSFVAGCENLFSKLPDKLPARAWQKLRAGRVLPVPVSSTLPPRPPTRDPGATLEIVWNHRWEYDKGPALLLAVAEQLLQRRIPVRLHVAGQQFRQRPAEFTRLETVCRQLGNGQFGHVSDEKEYQALLRRCDVVLSTAWHDFQGLGIQEACIAGCAPLAPHDLAYPEYLGSANLYQHGADDSETANVIVDRLSTWQQLRAQGTALPGVDLTHLCGEQIGSRYAAVIEELAT